MDEETAEAVIAILDAGGGGDSNIMSPYSKYTSNHDIMLTSDIRKDQAWLLHFEALTAFQESHGHCNVPYQEGPLGRWVFSQRQAYKKKRIREFRKELLDEIGFDWSLCKVNEKQKDTAGPPETASETVTTTETTEAESFMPLIPRFDNEKWLDKLASLKAFQQENGHFDVPKSDRSLSGWVNKQRKMLHEGQMEADRKAILDGIGFVWRPPLVVVDKKKRKERGSIQHSAPKRDQEWLEKLEQLKEFQQERGHCNVPRNAGKLGMWVECQRQVFRYGNMRADRFKLLNEIVPGGGFIWNPQQVQKERLHAIVPGKTISVGTSMKDTKGERNWQQHYVNLRVFQHANGHCRVPRSYGKLGMWVDNQRQWFKMGKMREHRKELLDKIGFIWYAQQEGKKKRKRAVEAETTTRLTEAATLLTLRQQTNRSSRSNYVAIEAPETTAPTTEATAPILQQTTKSSSHEVADPTPETAKSPPTTTIEEAAATATTTPDTDSTEQWLQNFASLKAFQAVHGHCYVPKNNSTIYWDNTKLHHWAHMQRKKLMAGQMQKERKELLETIGFIWAADYRYDGQQQQQQQAKKQKVTMAEATTTTTTTTSSSIAAAVGTISTIRQQARYDDDNDNDGQIVTLHSMLERYGRGITKHIEQTN